MASIERKETGAYAVRWRTLRGRARQHTCASLKLAKECVRRIEDAHDRGEEWDPRRLRAAPSLAQASRDYLIDRRRKWAASTVNLVSITLSTFLVWMGDADELYPEDLSRARLADYWDHLVYERELARGTANDRVGHIHAWWDWCRDHDEYGDLFPRVRRLDLPEVSKVVRPAPTWAQMDAAIRSGWASRAPWYGDLFLVLRCTGIRKSQALRLDWRDLDLDQARLRIRPELGKSKSERRGRVVPLAPVLVRELAGWGRRSGRLFGDHPKDPSRDVLKSMWERTDIPEELYRQPCHTFRRGFISGLAGAGVDEEVRRVLVGHTGGVHGDDYTNVDVGLWGALVEAVALVPELTAERAEGVVDLPSRRSEAT